MLKVKKTEQKILDAAKTVFTKRGYYGARMQDIADIAGINKAMLHYYFRNKDTLFQKILSEVLDNLFDSISKILNSKKPFDEKVNNFINIYIDTINQNRFLPAFIINELNHNKERFLKIVEGKIKKIPNVFIKQLQNEMSNGGIRQVEPLIVIINLIALVIMPFIAKDIIEILFGLNEKKFNKFIEDRKNNLKEFIFNGIKK